MLVKLVNKDEALLKWAAQNPYLTDALLMDFLNENHGACAIVPIAGEAVLECFLDGSAIKTYDFMMQVMLLLSDTTDLTNVNNLYLQRSWQEWINEMENAGNYPDFGELCGLYELQNLSNMPQMAQSYENGYAKYQFAARLKYLEGNAENL